MAIYQLFDQKKKENFTETFEPIEKADEKSDSKSLFFSTLITRFCFFLLLIADIAWLAYNMIVCIVIFCLYLLTGGKRYFKKAVTRSLLQLCRSAVCGLSLIVGLFSPPFGIMIACTYFLMYDKSGLEEVIPAPLQAQFKDIFKVEK